MYLQGLYIICNPTSNKNNHKSLLWTQKYWEHLQRSRSSRIQFSTKSFPHRQGIPTALIKSTHMSPHTTSLPQSIHQLQSFLSVLTLLNKIIYIKVVFVHTSPNPAAGSARQESIWDTDSLYSLLDNSTESSVDPFPNKCLHWNIPGDAQTQNWSIPCNREECEVVNVLFRLKWVVSVAAIVTSTSLTLISLSMGINWFISTALLWFDIYLV